jgi:hypothetical protein
MTRTTKPACACGRENFSRREDQNFSNFDHIVLDLSRFMLNIFGYKDGTSWMLAMELAEQAAGPGDGPVLLARVTAMIRAVVQERPGTFHYLSPCCLHISEHEIAMMQAVQKAETLVQGPACERTKHAIVALVSPLVAAGHAESSTQDAFAGAVPSTVFH